MNTSSKILYLIGSLRNPRIPELAKRIREENPDVEVFDDWYSAGPEADDCWKTHQKGKGLTYKEALEGYAARNVFSFDKRHLDRSTHTLLVLPAGKSGHMEIMYATYGVGAKTAILLDPEDVRWDVMYQFIPTILESDDGIKSWLEGSGGNVQGESDKDLLSSARRRVEEGVADGGRSARLLSERPSRDCPPFQISWGQASPGGTPSLGTGEEYGPSKQDTKTLGRLWKEGYRRK